MKKNMKNRKGFTLVELLATIVILGIIVSITLYIAINVIAKAKNKTYEVTVNNVVANAKNYLLENNTNVGFVADDNNTNIEYSCISVQNLIDTGYLDNLVTESYISADDKVKGADNIYVERDKSSKTVTKSVYVTVDSAYGNFCAVVANAKGRINITVNPNASVWAREKNANNAYSINYINTYSSSEFAKYGYYYKLYDTSGTCYYTSDTRQFTNFNATDEFTITKEGTISANIVSINDVRTITTKSYYVSKIDREGPEITLVNQPTGNISNQATYVINVTDRKSGVNYDSFTKDDLMVTIGDTVIYTFTLTRGNDGNYNLVISDTTHYGPVGIKVKENSVFDKVNNGNNEKDLNPTAVWYRKVAIPTASEYCLNPTYTGSSISIVRSALTGYSFGTLTGINAGSYDVVATLDTGYMWADKTTTTKTISCKIEKATCAPPTNVQIATDGKVSYTASASASSYEISMTGNTNDWINHTNGSVFSKITEATGSRTVYVRSKCDANNYTTPSTNATKTTTVYKVSLTKGTNISSVTGAGNYINGATVNIDANASTGYSFDKWTQTSGGSSVSATKTYSFTLSGTVNYTANAKANTNTAYKVNHYVHNLGTNTYTLESTENKTGTTAASLTVANLKKTITGFTYVDGYLTGGTTKPSSGATITTTILADGSRVINLYYRRNYLYVQYHVNGGALADAHGSGYSVSNSLVVQNSSSGYFMGVYGSNVGGIDTSTYEVNAYGLHDTTNASAINLQKVGYVAKSGAQWNTKADGTGTSYSQSESTYQANGFAGADLSTGDKTVTLYVNWVPATNTPYVVKHYVHDLGTNTYTLNSTDNLTGTTGATLTVANLKKTIAGFTYVDGYITGGSTKPTSGAVATTTILADGTRVINLYYRRNYLYVQYHVNGGALAETHGSGYTVENSLIKYDSSTKFFRGVYGSTVGGVNGNTYVVNNSGLENYNNSSYINIVKAGYKAVAGGEWNTKSDGTGSSYDQNSQTIQANGFAGADLSTGDKTVTLYVNWTVATNTPYKVNHYVHNLGANTYTLDSTENKTGTTNATLTLADLKKTISGFTYVDGYLSGGTTKPTSGAVTTTTILANGTREINLYYRRNYLYIQYNVNGGSMASAHGSSCGVNSDSLIYDTSNNNTKYRRGVFGGKVGGVNTTTYVVDENGLHDANNASGINLEKTGYTLKSNAQWNTKADGTGTSYSQTTKTYDADNFAGVNLATGDKTVTLYANWEPQSYTLTVHANGGTLPSTSGWTLDGTVTGYKTIKYKDSYGTLPTPTRAGYVFNGWSNTLDAGTFTATASSTNNYAWYYVYRYVKPGETYHITIGSATKKSGSATTFTTRIYDFTDDKTLVAVNKSFGNNVTYDVTVPSTANRSHDLNILFYAGVAGSTAGNSVEFKNIKIRTNNDSLNTTYTKDSKVNVTSNHELVALWTPKSIKVTFNCNGGSQTSGATNPVTYTYGVSGNKFPNPAICTRSNYDGDTWSAPNGNTYSWTSGVSDDWINNVYDNKYGNTNHNITLTANWTVTSTGGGNFSICANANYKVTCNGKDVVMYCTAKTETKTFTCPSDFGKKAKVCTLTCSSEACSTTKTFLIEKITECSTCPVGNTCTLPSGALGTCDGTNCIKNPGQGGSGSGCFLAGTKVMTDKGYKNIDKIKVGDVVLAYDEETDTNVYRKVTHTFEFDEREENLYTLVFGDKTKLKVTATHYFYIKRGDDTFWLPAKEIIVGDSVRYADGSYHIVKKSTYREYTGKVYNLTVDNSHNYYVGRQQILVHNVGVCGSKACKYDR